MRYLVAIAIFCLTTAPAATGKQKLKGCMFLEQVAPKQASMEEAASGKRYTLDQRKIWVPGQTVKVAFKGGSPRIHACIAEAATEWTRWANIKFDFGYDPKRHCYRTWDLIDTEYSADIRISFDQPGHWSVIGTESIDSAIFGPGDPSMNFELSMFFDRDWHRSVLHEFGHALGLHHEHQNPVVACDFRWLDDYGYVPTTDADGMYIEDLHDRRPGVYTWCSGYPNKWSKEKVDRNFRQLSSSEANAFSYPDRNSIMQYCYPDILLRQGSSSLCACNGPRLGLSELDKIGISSFYPFPK